VFPAKGHPERHLVCTKKAFSRALEIAGLADSDLVIHSLRHSFCSQLVQSGLSLQVMQNLVGHRQISTTARYGHLADHQHHAAAAKVAQMMQSAMG
jgi:site-specific recombinase XerD